MADSPLDPSQDLPGPRAGDDPDRRRGSISSQPYSAMAARFNWVFRWFARRFFGHFHRESSAVERLRTLESSGAVVYVMRYSSRLDYFLFNTLFLREGLRLSRFANGFDFFFCRPLREAVPLAIRRPWGRPREVEHGEERRIARNLVRRGDSFFLFLRTTQRAQFSRRRARLREDELDLLLEVVRGVWDSEEPVSVVPLALFWRKGPRAENRFLNLNYGSITRPSDLAKVTSFLATYRSLSVKIGESIDLSSFIASRRSEGPVRVARKVRRSMLLYFYREEKVVEGPTVRTRQRVLGQIIQDPRVKLAIQERAARYGGKVDRAERDAEKLFFEIAANMNSTFLAALAGIAGWIFKRMFASVEVEGLEKVADFSRWDPIVLVPNHRSYFDFLIISWLFYVNYLVPPHIYARDNMAFGPFGFLFRRAGAFFARGRFDDPLYKEIFRSYVAYLVREGFTQEFFIEGGRSRTGKTLAPRFGMLSWDVDAFVRSSRRDLFFVPVGLTYERLVEEGSIVSQQKGAAKEKESLAGLVRAGKFLQRRFGTAHVNFGEPLSLAEALGSRRREFAQAGPGERDAERREFVESLAHRIVEKINAATAANATAVAASVLLGSRAAGMRRVEFTDRMGEVVELLRLQDVQLTKALLADEGDFGDCVGFLERAGLVRVTEGLDDAVIFFEENSRQALDLYRNSIVHFLAAPSFMARGLLAGGLSREALGEDVAGWLELLYREYFVPPADTLSAHCTVFLDFFEARGWVETVQGEGLQATALGRGPLEGIAAQTEGVLEVYRCLFEVIRQAEPRFRRREILEEATAVFERSRLVGETSRVEALNETTLSNALDLLLHEAVIQVDPQAPVHPREVELSRGESWDRLAELGERLAGALSGG